MEVASKEAFESIVNQPHYFQGRKVECKENFQNLQKLGEYKATLFQRKLILKVSQARDKPLVTEDALQKAVEQLFGPVEMIYGIKDHDEELGYFFLTMKDVAHAKKITSSLEISVPLSLLNRKTESGAKVQLQTFGFDQKTLIQKEINLLKAARKEERPSFKEKESATQLAETTAKSRSSFQNSHGRTPTSKGEFVFEKLKSTHQPTSFERRDRVASFPQSWTPFDSLQRPSQILLPSSSAYSPGSSTSFSRLALGRGDSNCLPKAGGCSGGKVSELIRFSLSFKAISQALD